MAISNFVNEESTAVVSISPADEEGNTLEFGDLINPSWQLMDELGNIINSRSFANCPLTSLKFVLYGDDLAHTEGESQNRILAIKFNYNSSAGNNLPCIVEHLFKINNLKSQS